MDYTIPVLLVTFNRPDTTAIVFDKIRQLRPRKLYLFSDAPRIGNTEDLKRVEETRKIIGNISWPCELHTNYEQENLGCGMGVSKAISWVFSKEEMAIVLEDDCVPELTFFSYCQEMLERFKDDPRVMHISGTRWNPEFSIEGLDYFFSKISHIWGWATWKRAWSKYDYQMSSWNEYKASNTTHKLFGNQTIADYWDGAFDYVYQQQAKHTWDYQWQFTLFLNNGLAVVPVVNLVQNIGTTGVHASKTSSPNLFKQTSPWPDREHRSLKVEAFSAFDEYHMLHHFITPATWKTRIKKTVKTLLGRK